MTALLLERFDTRPDENPYRLSPESVAAGITLGYWADLYPQPPLYPNPEIRHEYEILDGELQATNDGSTGTPELYFHGLGSPSQDIRWTVGTVDGPEKYLTFIFRFDAATLDRLYYVEHWIDQGDGYAPHPLALRYADYRPEWLGLPGDVQTLATSDVVLADGDEVRIVTIEQLGGVALCWIFVNDVLVMSNDNLEHNAGQTSVGMGGYSRTDTGGHWARWRSLEVLPAPSLLAMGGLPIASPNDVVVWESGWDPNAWDVNAWDPDAWGCYVGVSAEDAGFGGVVHASPLYTGRLTAGPQHGGIVRAEPLTRGIVTAEPE